MNRSRLMAAVVMAAALTAAVLLDPWAWRHLQYAPVYERDWGRLLRVSGSLVLWLPLAVAIWLERRASADPRPGRAWLVLLGPAVAGGVAELLKIGLRRERPGLHDGAYVFRSFLDRPFETKDIGLPSSHVMVAFGGATIIARLFPGAAPVAYLLAAGCGVTRILAHAHFASDVMLGALAGWATAALLWRRFGERRDPSPR